MAWWTRVGDKIEKHDGRKPKLDAAITLRFATSMDGVKIEDCGLYKRDPVKHPDEPNLLPEMAEKERTKRLAAEIKGMLRGGRV